MRSDNCSDRSADFPAKWLPLAVVAGFPLLVFGQLAATLYQANRHLLSADDAPWPWLAALLIPVWAVMLVALRFGGPCRRYIWAVFGGYAFFLLLREFAFPAPLGALDGASPFAGITAGYQILEFSVLAITIVAMALVPPRITTRLASFLSVAFAAFLVFTIVRSSGSNDALKPTGGEIPVQLASAESDRKPDIFHIMYDTYQTVEHEYTVHNSGHGVAPYQDFVFFPNNVANYNFTVLVLPATFLGTLYTPDKDLTKWKQELSTTGLLQILKSSGYKINGHSYHESYFTSPLSDYERHTLDVVADAESQSGLSRQASFVRTPFFELVTLRSLPTAASKYVLQTSQADEQAQTEIPPRTASAYYCMVKFREILQKLKSTPAGNNYYFIHLILPHSPFVLDKDGNYLGGDHSTHYQQALFADKLTAELISELKSLGRYDQSLIVMQADTGEYFVPDVAKQRLVDGDLLSYVTPRWKDGELVYADEVAGGEAEIWPIADRPDARLCPEEIVRARSQSLLLIKPPFHRGYEVNSTPSQSTDIAPTILGAIGVDYDPLEFPQGVDVLNNPPAEDRIRKTFVLGALRSGKRTGGLQEWEVRGDHFKKRESIRVRDDNDIYRMR